MDHLPLPKNPSKPCERVPLVCFPYDGGDFLSYPGRVGWDHATAGETPEAFVTHERISPSDDRRLESFLQCWLFFGFVNLLGGRQGDFVDNGFVHTRNLSTLNLSAPDEYFLKCLERMEDVLMLFNDSGENVARPGFNPVIQRSLVAFYSFLVSIADLRTDWKPKDGFGARLQSDHMVTKGWCPFKIAREERLSSAVAYMHYIEHLEIPDENDHALCKTHCRHATINEGYDCRHAAGCKSGCQFIGPELDDVDAILEQGTFPLLKVEYDIREVTESQRVRPKVIPVEGQGYVAISHVWADGLGNPRAAEIPSCQLKELKRLVRSLQGHKYEQYGKELIEDRQLHLWIDTLLCPQKRSSYDLSMSHMRKVYTNATYVLVLDRVLRNTTYDDPLEAMARIQVSQWATRMWTLQEAALPSRLLFCFQNRIVDYRELRDAMKRGHGDIMKRRLCTTLLFKTAQMRFTQAELNGTLALQILWMGMANRQVSLAKDQPLCAGTLLGLDTAQIAMHQTLAARMMAFWELLAASKFSIPCSIIFGERPRLRESGFRWAPADIIDPTNTTEWRVALMFGGETPARLTAQGLRVCLPSWRIEMISRTTAVPMIENTVHLSGTIPVFCHIRNKDGHWFLAMREAGVIGSQKGLMQERAELERDPDEEQGNGLKTPAGKFTSDTLYGRSTWHFLFNEKVPQPGEMVFALLGQVSEEQFAPTARFKLKSYSAGHNIIAEAAFKHATEVLQSYNQWMLEISTLIAGTIAIAQLEAFRRHYHYQIQLDIVKRSKTECQTPEVREAMRLTQNDSPNPEGYLQWHISLFYFGRFAEVDEAWESSKAWLVDG